MTDVWSIAFILGLGLVCLWAGAVTATAWMLTHPPRRTYAAAVARGKPGDPSELPSPRPFEAWTFRSRGLDLPVWDIKGEDPDGPTVLMTHGWADSRIGSLARIPALAALASRIVAWDLPGHGEAPGLSLVGIAESIDLLALINHIRAQRPLVLYGWSMGAGISLAVAAAAKPAAVIAESPYRLAPTPAASVLAARGLPYRTTLGPALAIIRLLAWMRGVPASPFDRARDAAAAGCPVLVLHGELDVVCPIEDGRAIAGAANPGRLVAIGNGHHNDLWADPRLATVCAAEAGAALRSVRAP